MVITSAHLADHAMTSKARDGDDRLASRVDGKLDHGLEKEPHP